MKKRRRYHKTNQSTDTSKLDIFLDVLMNAVGIFMLIAMLLSLQVSLAQRLVLDISRPPKDEKKPYFFEVRGNDVIDLSETRQLVNDRVDDLYVYQAACFLESIEDYEICVDEAVSEFETFQLETEYYQVSVNWEAGSFLYEPIDTQVSSENSTEGLQKVSFGTENSPAQLESYLEKVDPEQYYLVFITRPNGFSTYREAREIAVSKNFEVGWEPYPYNQPLIFTTSGSGRAIGVQ